MFILSCIRIPNPAFNDNLPKRKQVGTGGIGGTGTGTGIHRNNYSTVITTVVPVGFLAELKYATNAHLEILL